MCFLPQLFVADTKQKRIVEEAVKLCQSMQEKWIVVSVGGSLIVPDEIDTEFLASLTRVVETHVQEGFRFAIIAGGGKTARRYQHAANTVSTLTRDDLDWIGIHATRLNGHLIKTLLRNIAHPRVVRDVSEVDAISEPVLVAAGEKPGQSTDFMAIALAEKLGAQKVVNLSNIDYVYESDPRKNPDAKKFETISWKDFRALIPTEWDPGLSSPFDPVASARADMLGVEVAILHGKKLGEFENYLSGEKFIGTVIS